ncbi:MAG: hypothetical protein KF730_17280 [Sphingomonas sp.]|uniref:DUF5677 domain-containing protein n=1 Tax=Sphingomonas sp. TaxID=28214 RepID=UPI0025FF1952|nr:DUF5677 domain-containing protein [Sphingomonas sp.]MBX3566315.1 hypothetical protein [Sphingomonas sp.]
MLAQLRDVPQLHLKAQLEALIDIKLPGAPAGFTTGYAEHILSGNSADFHFDDNSLEDIDIEITSAEMEEMVTATWAFIDNDVPEITAKIIDDSAKLLAKALHKDWPGQRAWQIETQTGFRTRLEARWGKAFDLLRMMYTIAYEIGGDVQQRARRSRARRNLVLRDTLIHLHVRACQVVAEILCLMENGFADGAMARWRTLHEIVIVASVIAEHGEELAERYRAHEAIEAKRALDRFLVSHTGLGLAPPSQADIRVTERRYQAMLVRYGDNFGAEYGWAAHHLQLKKPRFIDLEAAANKLAMRSYYVLASYNVHASAKGIAHRLGLIKGPGSPSGISGASNAGFIDPAQNAAFDLTAMTALLVQRGIRIDRAIELKALVVLRDKMAGALAKAQRELLKAHRDELSRRQAAKQG